MLYVLQMYTVNLMSAAVMQLDADIKGNTLNLNFKEIMTEDIT